MASSRVGSAQVEAQWPSVREGVWSILAVGGSQHSKMGHCSSVFQRFSCPTLRDKQQLRSPDTRLKNSLWRRDPWVKRAPIQHVHRTARVHCSRSSDRQKTHFKELKQNCWYTVCEPNKWLDGAITRSLRKNEKNLNGSHGTKGTNHPLYAKKRKSSKAEVKGRADSQGWPKVKSKLTSSNGDSHGGRSKRMLENKGGEKAHR